MVWLYASEAKKLRFKKSYALLPKELHPIVIGSFFLRSKATLLLDLRSCERALLAIPFFNTHLPRRLVELEDAEVVNRLFPGTKTNLQLSPEVLFDRQISTSEDPEVLIRQLTEKTANVGIRKRGLESFLKISNPGRSNPYRKSSGCPYTSPRTALEVSSWHYNSGKWSPCSTGWATPCTPWTMRSNPSCNRFKFDQGSSLIRIWVNSTGEPSDSRQR